MGGRFSMSSLALDIVSSLAILDCSTGRHSSLTIVASEVLDGDLDLDWDGAMAESNGKLMDLIMWKWN